MRAGASEVRSVGHSRDETDRSAQQSTDLEDLVKSQYAVVYNVAFRVLGQREDAEDIAQQTFVRALPHLSQLREQTAAGRWLCRITANLCVDELRRRSRQATAADIDEAALDDLADKDVLGTPAVAAELHETRVSVWRATLALPPQQRLALALREWHQMSYAEIAAAMGTSSVAAVEALLFRAREGFRLAYTGRKARVPRAAECEWVTEHLSASIDHELSHREALRIDVHLPHCDACRFVARELCATSRLYALLPLVAPPTAVEAAVLVAVSGAGAGLTAAPALGAGAALSAGLGTVANVGGGIAMIVVAVMTAGSVWTTDPGIAALEAADHAEDLEVVALTLPAATPVVVVAPATAMSQSYVVLVDPTPTAELRTHTVVNGVREQRGSPVASFSARSSQSPPLAVPSDRIDTAPAPRAQTVVPAPAARQDHATAQGVLMPAPASAPPTPEQSKMDQPTNRSRSQLPDQQPADTAVDHKQPPNAPGRDAERKASSDPPSTSSEPPPHKAHPGRAAASSASQTPAAAKNSSGAGGPKSSDAHSATPSHQPSQPPPAPSAAQRGKTGGGSSAAQRQAPEHGGSQPKHSEKGAGSSKH